MVQSSIFGFLLLDVLPDGLLVPSNRGDEVASGPEALTGKVLLPAKKGPRNVDGALSFHVADHLSNSILGRDGDEHMYVIHHEMALHHIALLLFGQLSEHLPQLLAELLVERLLSAFWNPYRMVLALPYGVA